MFFRFRWFINHLAFVVIWVHEILPSEVNGRWTIHNGRVSNLQQHN